MVKRPVLQENVYRFLEWIAAGNPDEPLPYIHPGVVMWCEAQHYIMVWADPGNVGFELTITGVEKMRDLAPQFSDVARP